MGGEDRGWRLEVLVGADALRQERLTRALYEELEKVRSLSVDFVDDNTPPVAEGRKSAVAGDVALWVSMAAAARPTSQVLIALIKEWCGKDRHRKVELTSKGRSLTITGRPGEAQERMIREFLEKDRADDLSDQRSGVE